METLCSLLTYIKVTGILTFVFRATKLNWKIIIIDAEMIKFPFIDEEIWRGIQWSL